MKYKNGKPEKLNIYCCNYSDEKGWIEKNIAEENFAFINQIISVKNIVKNIPNIIVFDDQDVIYHSIIFTPYTILGEPIEISTPIKPEYSSSFIMDKYGFIHCVRTSLQVDGETVI